MTSKETTKDAEYLKAVRQLTAVCYSISCAANDRTAGLGGFVIHASLIGRLDIALNNLSELEDCDE